MRFGRRLLPALAFAGLIVALPRLVAAVAQRALAEALGPGSRAAVRFSSGPVAILGGHLRDLRVSAGPVPVSGLVLRRLTLTADRLDLDLPALLGAHRLIVRRSQGLRAHLTVGERALNAHLAKRGVHVRLGAGTVVVSFDRLRAVGRLTVEANRVAFLPDRVQVGGVPVPSLLWPRLIDPLRVTVDLSAFPVPLRLTGIEVRPGELAIAAAGAAS